MLIQNGLLVLEDRLLQGDLLLSGGRIADIGQHIKAGPDVPRLDARGCLVFPGFIDPHTHFQMKNALATTADDYASGSLAALFGGTTTILNYATCPADLPLPEGLRLEQQKAAACACDYLLHAEIVGFGPQTAQEMKTLSQQGLRSCKVYLAYGFRLSDADLYRSAAACREAGILLQVHCENGSLLDARLEELVQKGHTAVRYKAQAHPAQAEAQAVYTLGQVSLLTGCPVHVVHLSSKLGLEALALARQQGAQITAETCPQYLYLDESGFEGPQASALGLVCAPPPRREEDRKAILQALVDGRIQTLATDHCAYRLQGQKDQHPDDLRRIPGGLPGVEERATLCYTSLVASGLMDQVQFAALMSTNAAKLYGLYPQKGVLKAGADADLCIYDPGTSQTLTAATLHSQAGYTPYEGIQVQGRVRDVIKAGQLVIQDGQLHTLPQGRFLAQQPTESR